MGFFDMVNTILKSGFVSVVLGFGLYFVVLFTCKYCELQVGWRVGLTAAAIVIVLVPDAWSLAFYSDDHRNFDLPVAATAEGLWLAIKVKLVLGPLGHMLGLFADKHFLD